MESTMDATTSMTTPPEDVDNLMRVRSFFFEVLHFAVVCCVHSIPAEVTTAWIYQAVIRTCLYILFFYECVKAHFLF